MFKLRGTGFYLIYIEFHYVTGNACWPEALIRTHAQYVLPRCSRALALSNTGSPRFTDFVKSGKSDWLKIWKEYYAHAHKIGSGQSSRSLPQVRTIVGSENVNELPTTGKERKFPRCKDSFIEWFSSGEGTPKSLWWSLFQIRFKFSTLFHISHLPHASRMTSPKRKWFPFAYESFKD